jgi:hypothetical protein
MTTKEDPFGELLVGIIVVIFVSFWMIVLITALLFVTEFQPSIIETTRAVALGVFWVSIILLIYGSWLNRKLVAGL